MKKLTLIFMLFAQCLLADTGINDDGTTFSMDVPTIYSFNSIKVSCVDATDPDGDTVTVLFRWFVNGVERTDLNTTQSKGQNGYAQIVSAQTFNRGDKIKVRLVSHDGYQYGGWAETPELVILNAPPKITGEIGIGVIQNAR